MDTKTMRQETKIQFEYKETVYQKIENSNFLISTHATIEFFCKDIKCYNKRKLLF